MDKCLLTYDAFFKINGAENTAEQDESPENCGGPSVSLHAVSESVKPDVGSSQRQATDDCRYVREFSLAAISLSTASTYAHPPRPASTCGKIRFLETGCDVYVRACVCVCGLTDRAPALEMRRRRRLWHKDMRSVNDYEGVEELDGKNRTPTTKNVG